jgi:PAS domain S-box-containing protein
MRLRAKRLLEKTIWEIGFFKDIVTNQSKFSELQKKKFVRYEKLPIETADGRKINVEFISNVYFASISNKRKSNVSESDGIMENAGKKSTAAILRQKTEDLLKQNPLKSGSPLSEADTLKLIHELQVHQIELEVQNEALRQSQAELAAVQARYFDLYELAPAGYCTLSENGLILEANLAIATLLGAARSMMIKQSFSRFILPDDQDIYYLHRKQLLETGEYDAYDLRMVKKDGTIFWAHLSCSAARDAGSSPLCRIVINDITERKFQEEERDLAARLIVLINTPGDFRERMSELTVLLHGWSGCAAVGIRLREGDDYPYFETCGFPPAFVQAENHLCAYGPDGKILRDDKDVPILECMCGNILRGRFDPAKPFFTAHGSFWSNNTTALLASTTAADCQARTRNRCNGIGYESVALIPLRSGDQVFGLLQFNDCHSNRFTPSLIAHFERMADSLATALSQRQAVEEMLASNELLKLFVRHSPVYCYIKDVNSTRSLVLHASDNFQQMIGIPGSEMIGRTMEDLYSPEFAAKITADDWAVVSKGDVLRLDEELNGRSYTTIKFPINQGDKTLLAGYTIDITERKQAEEEKIRLEGQIQRTLKMESIGSLAGGIAHDLNNILFPISGLSEMLLDDIPPDTPERQLIEQIHKSANRGSALVKQILTFSHQSNPQKLPIRIQPILKEALKLAQATIPRNIEVKSHIDTDCGMIIADPTQIHQIAMNLITNAFHAVEQTGGMIDIALKETSIDSFGEKDELLFHAIPGDILVGRYACITVSDTGTGIDPRIIDKIFDPYFTTKELGKGTGLGLSVVHGIVKEHGGDIRVYSEVGKGTSFHVYLPLLEDAKNRKNTAVTRKHPTGCERILLVDDEEPIVHLEQMMLERLGYQVTTRTSSPDALDAFRANPSKFDLVISDKGMPNMTGEQLARELILIKPGIPIIICSGFSDENDEQQAKSLGVKGFLKKPVATGDLAAMVRKVLDEANVSTR